MKIEQQILVGCRANNHKSQEQLYKLCFSSFMRLAIRYSNNEDDAKDILNKGFLKIFMNIQKFNGDENNFFFWCKKIIVNESLDHIKSRAFKQSLQNGDNDMIEVSIYPEAEFKHESELILHYIQKLPLTTASVFNLFAIEGYSHNEIAEMLQITEGNSKWHLFSAREKLQNWIFKNKVK